MTGIRYGATEEGLKAALAALGGTPEEVAKTLADGGYRGKRENACACPVAQYVTAVTGREASVLGTAVMLLVDQTDPHHLRWIDVVSTDAVADFVYAFDTGMFDGLVRP